MSSLKVPDTDKVCRGCNTEVQKEVTRCERCNAPYHPGCIKPRRRCCVSSRSASPTTSTMITKEEMSTMMAGLMAEQLSEILQQIKPIHTMLNDVSNRVANIESSIAGSVARIESLEHEVEGIRGECALLENKIVASSEQTISKCMQELEDRQNRKSNIIMFNMPETGSSNIDIALNDKKEINDILKVLSPNTLPIVRSINRLGTRQQMSPQARPLRLTLDSEDTAQTLVSAFKKLGAKHAPLPPPIRKELSLSMDRTPLQMKLHKDARKIMEDRLAKGETGLRIVYRNGSPIIISKTHSPPSRPTQSNPPLMSPTDTSTSTTHCQQR